jgi:hypothetical protein
MAARLALLIATNTHEYPLLTDLTTPVNDVQALAEVLAAPDIGGFRVETLINPTTSQAGAAIGAFYASCAPGDLTLLYYSGHGIRHDVSEQLHLVTRDTSLANLVFSSIPATSIDLAMSTSLSTHKVVILDCCYAGAYPGGGKALPGVGAAIRFKELEGVGRTVLTSSGATQLSFETPQGGVGVARRKGEAVQSVFTRHLVAGLRDGSADLDHDGDISVVELYTYAFERVVKENPRQRPKRIDSVEGGTIILAGNPHWKLPREVRANLDSTDPQDRLVAVSDLSALYKRGNGHVRQETTEELRRLVADPSPMVARAALRPLRGILPPDQLPTPTAVSAPDATTDFTPAAQLIAASALVARDASRRISARAQTACRAAYARGRMVLPHMLPLLTAGLLFSGLFLPGTSGGSVFPHPGYHTYRWQASDVSFGVTGLALLTAVATVLAMRPRTPRLLGQGLLCGVAAASVWSLMAYVGMTHHTHDSGVLYPFWELAAHGLLLVSAAVPAVRMARDPDVVFRARRPGGATGWALLAISAAALAFAEWALAGVLYRTAAKGSDYLTDAHLALAVLCVVVPAVAALLAPARAALGLLAGFTAGAVAVGGNEFAVVATRSHSDKAFYGGPRDAALFVGAELLVLACALLLARRTAAVPRSRARRTILVGVLALAPLLLGGGTVGAVRTHDWQRLDTYAIEGMDVSPDGGTLNAFATNALVGMPHSQTHNREFVIDTATRKIVRVVTLPSDGLASQTSPDGRYRYELSSDGTRITVRDARTGAADGAPITVATREGEIPPSMQLSDDGRVLVLVYDSIAVVYDPQARKPTGVKLSLEEHIWWTTLSPDGSRLCSISGDSNEGVTCSPTNGQEGYVDYPEVDGEPAVRMSSFFFSPDSRRIYLGILPTGKSHGQDAVLALDARTARQVGGPVRVPGTGKGISFIEPTADDSRLFVLDDLDPDSLGPRQPGTISQVDTRTWTTAGTPVTVPTGHGRFEVSPDRGTIYIPVVHGLSVIPIAHPAERTTIPIGLGDPTPWGP